MRLDEIPTGLWLGVGGAILLVGGAAVGARYYRRYRARRALLARIATVALDHLQDVILPDGNGGWFHVDFVLLTPAGVLVVDLRDVAGVVFGSEPMTEWTVMHKSRRYTFPNPLGPLYDRIVVVRQIAGEGVPVAGRVVFTDRSSFPKGHPPHCTKLGSLAEEFPLPDPAAASAAVACWQVGWQRLRDAATPSPLRRGG